MNYESWNINIKNDKKSIIKVQFFNNNLYKRQDKLQNFKTSLNSILIFTF